MELHTYSGEHFERSKWRYVIFFAIVAIFSIWPIIYSERNPLYHDTTNAMVGAVIVLLIVGGYFFFSTKMNEIITLKIEESWLTIGKKTYVRSEFSGFVLEYHTQTKSIHNIVFITRKGHEIFTIQDTTDAIKAFAMQLADFLPLLDTYNQTLREKFLRKIKL
jgi:hypothetical protein